MSREKELSPFKSSAPLPFPAKGMLTNYSIFACSPKGKKTFL